MTLFQCRPIELCQWQTVTTENLQNFLPSFKKYYGLTAWNMKSNNFWCLCCLEKASRGFVCLYFVTSDFLWFAKNDDIFHCVASTQLWPTSKSFVLSSNKSYCKIKVGLFTVRRKRQLFANSYLLPRISPKSLQNFVSCSWSRSGHGKKGRLGSSIRIWNIHAKLNIVPSQPTPKKTASCEVHTSLPLSAVKC